jgi:hypothetical protein
MLGLPIECIGAVLKNALHPLVKKEPWTIDVLIQHARWKQVGQFQFEMMNELFIDTDGLDTLDLSRHERIPFGSYKVKQQYKGYLNSYRAFPKL